MNKYKLGIMSNTWDVEALNVDVAVMALRIWGGYSSIPIANFSTEEQSKFMTLLGAPKDLQDEAMRFIQDNSQEVKAAIKTIQEVV